MSISKTDYVQRIVSATPNQLNIITFELCITNIENAIKNFDININEYTNDISTAIALLKEIILSLDFKYDISKDLYQIYIFINKLLIKAKLKFIKSDLECCINCLTEIKNAFEQLEDIDDSKSVVKNATKVFAGLTYGKNGSLSEYIDDSPSRGFQA